MITLAKTYNAFVHHVNYKVAVLSFICAASLTSCASDPATLEKEAKAVSSMSAVDFAKHLEKTMFFYHLEKLTEEDDSSVHIYRTRGIYDVSYIYLSSRYRKFCMLKGGELHYQFCTDKKRNIPLFFVSFTNHRASTDGHEVNSEMSYITDTALLGYRTFFFETHVYEPSKGADFDNKEWLNFAKEKGFRF